MTELRVPTVVLPVEIECADGRIFAGRIFVPAASPIHDGPTRPEEWMNDGSSFFPFLADDSERPVLMNKREVLVLSVAMPGNQPAEALDSDSPVRRVRVEAEKRRLEGELVIEMPPGHLRVLDYLNRAEPFLLLREGEIRHLIQKERITRVIELHEE